MASGGRPPVFLSYFGVGVGVREWFGTCCVVDDVVEPGRVYIRDVVAWLPVFLHITWTDAVGVSTETEGLVFGVG